MPNLRSIETFVKALEGGSIASAARQLGISPAAASQNIARLERELGTRLITRTTRSMALTEAGERYLARVGPVLQELEKAQSDLSQLHGELQGRLRIACMAAFGRHVLAPLLPAFAAQHPRLELELLVVDRQVDVLKEDVDISVRYRDVLEPGMAVRQLAAVPRVLCASPAYLQAHGRPRTAQDLLDHACLLYRREADGRFMRWPFSRDGKRVDPQLRVTAIASDVDALTEMAVAGAALSGSAASLPTATCAKDCCSRWPWARRARGSCISRTPRWISSPAFVTASTCRPRCVPWWTTWSRRCRSSPCCAGTYRPEQRRGG